MGNGAVKSLIKALAVLLVFSLYFNIANVASSLGLNRGPIPSDRPAVFIDPYVVEAKVGEYVTFSVKVFNLTDNYVSIHPKIPTYHWIGNLYGFDIKFSWNPTILTYVNHTVKVPVDDYPDGVLHSPYLIIKDEVNVAGGRYHLAVCSIAPAPAFNNPNRTSTIFEMRFKVTGGGACYLRLVSTDLAAKPDPERHWVSAVIYHHPKWPYPGFNSNAYCKIQPLIRGDVNGDGKVDIYDVVRAAAAYGSRPGHPNWEPLADLAPEYGIIDIFDIVTTIYYWEKHASRN